MVKEPIRSISLPARFSSVRQARHFVIDILSGAGIPEMNDDAALCVTELISNVVRHTHSERCRLTVDCREGHIRLEVEDDSLDTPVVHYKSAAAEAGRGMQIVMALAEDWGVDTYPGDGKAVWVRLR